MCKCFFMKQIFTFIVAIFFSVGAFAATNITLSIASIKNISRVVVDGRTYNNYGNRAIVINNLKQGYRNIKVYTTDGSYRNYREQLLYSGRVLVRNGYFTDVMITRKGRAFVDSDRLNNQNQFGFPYIGNSSYGYNVMSNAAFLQLKSSVENEGFDQTRGYMVEAAMANNSFETAQVKELLKLFSFENNRLDMAKKLYDVTVDKEKYNQVYDVFNFSSSKEALSKFMLEQRSSDDGDDF